MASASYRAAAIVAPASLHVQSYEAHNGNWWMQRLSQQEVSTSRSESCYLEHVGIELFLRGEENKSQRGWDPQTVASTTWTCYTVRTLGVGVEGYGGGGGGEQWTGMTFCTFWLWIEQTYKDFVALVSTKCLAANRGLSENKQNLALCFAVNRRFQNSTCYFGYCAMSATVPRVISEILQFFCMKNGWFLQVNSVFSECLGNCITRLFFSKLLF